MSAIDCFPLYHFRGDALTRGLNYGESLANRIRETFNFYNNRLFKRSRFSVNEFKTRAEHVRTMLGAFDAELVTELDAVARGAELPRWQIYLLNARTEILNAGVSECTALAIPEARLLGQTWDWFEGFDELAILVKYSPDSGPSIFTFTEPGMLAKIGFNERCNLATWQSSLPASGKNDRAASQETFPNRQARLAKSRSGTPTVSRRSPRSDSTKSK